jgi:hypothetical protein
MSSPSTFDLLRRTRRGARGKEMLDISLMAMAVLNSRGTLTPASK